MKYKGVYQHDTCDCGAACLATVCSYYGLNLPLSRIKTLCSGGADGISMYELIQAAEMLGFSASALEGTDVELIESIKSKEIRYPFIAHVISGDMLHYVVMVNNDNAHVRIFDPAIGQKKITWESFVSMWTGNIISLELTNNFHPADERGEVLKLFLKPLKENKKYIIQIILLSMAISLISIGGILAYQHIVDHFLVHQGYSVIKEMDVVFASILIAYIVRLGIYITRGYISAHLSGKLELIYSSDFMLHLLRSNSNYINSMKRGGVLQRVRDVGCVRDTLSILIINLALDSILAAGSGIIMIMQSWRLFISTMLIACLYCIQLLYVRRRLFKANRTITENEARTLSIFGETCDGLETLQSTNAENYYYDAGKSVITDMARSNMECRKISVVNNGASLSIEAIGALVLFWLGAHMVVEKSITIGVLATSMILLDNILVPIRGLLDAQDQLQRFSISTNRIFDVYCSDVESNGAEEPPLSVGSRDISLLLKDVTFNYGDGNVLLNHINLEIRKGEKVAVSGCNGSGKTTLAKLMVGLYKPTSGMIMAGDMTTDRNNFNGSKRLSKVVAYVPQNVFLFSKSIEDNILLGRRIPHEKLEQLIYSCHINDLMATKASVISEGATNVSAGEKQRIGIARSLIGDPEVLIFDECTSNLDLDAKEAIMDIILDNCKGKSCIFITHDPDVARKCDRVLLLENGGLVEIE